jgi:uncharacterized membrane protein YczE
VKEILDGFFKKDHFFKRLAVVVAAVVVMGFAVSLLLLADFGIDPCTFMNNSISAKIGISLGNWQAFLNVVMLIFVVIFGGRNLGFGTIANMFLVGYSIDFFSWIWRNFWGADFFSPVGIRIALLFPAVILFVFSAAVYMNMDLGTAPYDAISFIISSRIPKIPFRFVRIFYDSVVTVAGILFGGKLKVASVIMVFTLGPAIDYVAHFIRKKGKG